MNPMNQQYQQQSSSNDLNIIHQSPNQEQQQTSTGILGAQGGIPSTSSSPTTSNDGSPRRRNPPIDLDAALYIQSKASCVQELAIPSQKSSNGVNSSAQQFDGKPVTSKISDKKSVRFSPLIPVEPSIPPGSQQNVTQPRRPTFGELTQQQSHTSRYGFHQSNISVDYIDCLSNEDLPPERTPTSLEMRSLSHCRRHLRFHRNRVEPEASAELIDASANSATAEKQLSIPGGGGRIGSPVESTITTSASSSSNTETTTSEPQLRQFNHETLEAAQSQRSVLYPISVSDVKRRTYFFGSVCEDSLLGQEELYRYFPNGKVNIFVCTWNQNRKRSPTNLNDLLLPERLVHMPDVYAIGIQEAFSSQQDYLREWDIELQTTLGPNHVLLHSCSLGVLHLSIFVRRDLIWFCSTPEESLYNSRSMPTNMIKTKGAVSIAFRFFGTSFMFTNCHFPAHENRLRDRVDEYQKIINSIDLPKNLKLLKPRLEQRSFDETIQILEDIFHQREPTYEALTQNDELVKVMETNLAFHGFDEGLIKFPPTYKFLAQTNRYDKQTKRVPSYTDRILFRSKRQRHIQCLIYDWLPQLLSSDHKPVFCLFEVLIRPGQEQNMISSLNAGLFQRPIYLEALKRRAEDPDCIRENGTGGNLICSIS